MRISFSHLNSSRSLASRADLTSAVLTRTARVPCSLDPLFSIRLEAKKVLLSASLCRLGNLLKDDERGMVPSPTGSNKTATLSVRALRLFSLMFPTKTPGGSLLITILPRFKNEKLRDFRCLRWLPFSLMILGKGNRLT